MHPVLGITFTSVGGALAWRVRKLLGDPFVDQIIVSVARAWRPFLRKPVFIGITGSAGKTTTKELLLGMLSHKSQGIGNPASCNVLPEVAKAILRVRPTHDFCTVELSEDRPDALDQPLALYRPSVGIVTVVGNDHLSAFDSQDAIAAEVAKLIASLPASGTAVLNADDELILAMAKNCAAQVITYGISPNANLRAEDISADWPDRLQMTVVHGAERVKIHTQLCGSHWIPSVLGAIGGALATGMSLTECAEGIAGVAPFEGRMQPVTTPDGVTFIRDDFKAPLWTVGPCFEFMKAARAKRKIIVIGTLSDYGTGTGASKKYAELARRAQAIADVTIFVGSWASSAYKTRQAGQERALRAFSHVQDAAEFVNTIKRDGDLVLIKGTNKQDHLLRIILARSRDMACWRDDCKKDSFCNACPHRTKPTGAPVLLPNRNFMNAMVPLPPSDANALDPDEQVIVGLGNPGAEYARTPHNIGYEVVDGLATMLGLAWNQTPAAWVARGSLQGRGVCLVKIRTAMNLTGDGLRRLSTDMAFRPDQCILVYDDLDIPLGAVRNRLRGGAGGHRGVASILEAFQTDAFRRVKVGVGQAGGELNRIEYALTVFDAASRASVDGAISTAKARTVEMVKWT